MQSDQVKNVMFHHFHNDDYFIQQQGSISASQLERMLDNLFKRNYKILDPTIFLSKIENGSLTQNEIVLTFDDALKCQFEIAVPVLKKYNLKAFFFIQSAAILKNDSVDFEVLRDFRHRCFNDIEHFYNSFFGRLPDLSVIKAKDFISKNNFLSDRYYLSMEDRIYRACRDFIVDQDDFSSVHLDMMKAAGYDWVLHRNKLQMSSEDIVELIRLGHQVGLHSFSHPLNINSLNFPDQVKEYKKNKHHLESAFHIDISSVSYPCGLTNQSAIDSLSSMGIKLGFMATPDYSQKNRYMLPRTNHVSLIL